MLVTDMLMSEMNELDLLKAAKISYPNIAGIVIFGNT